MTDEQWTILRQVIVAAPDDVAVAEQWRQAFGLGEGFADPELEGIGLHDVTLRVGPEAYLQSISSAADDAPVNRWLQRNGGPGGYLLSIQVPDVARRVAAAETAGVRAVLDTIAFGHRVVHLFSKELGLILELDEIDDPGVWFWDDIQPAEDLDPLVSDVAAVEMATPDPDALAALWAAVFEVDVDRSTGAPVVWLGRRAVRFVQGDRTRMTAIELTAARAEPSAQVIAGVETRVVSGAGATS